MVELNYADNDFAIVTVKTATDNDFAGIQFNDPITGQDLVVVFSCDAEFLDPDYKEEEVNTHPSLTYYAVRHSARSIIATAMRYAFDTVTPEQLAETVKTMLNAYNTDPREEVKRGIGDAIDDIKKALYPLT